MTPELLIEGANVVALETACDSSTRILARTIRGFLSIIFLTASSSSEYL